MAAEMDKVFKALADRGRRVLLDRLRAENGQTLGQLCEHLDMTRQAVTKHLKLLEEASLVVTIWRGREKLHYLNPVPIHEIADRWIGKFERGRLRVLAELKKQLEGETDPFTPIPSPPKRGRGEKWCRSASPARAESRPCTRSESPLRHAALGDLAASQRRRVGRLRLRCGKDRGEDGGEREF
jgi:DNA-binding transcriptional ArsR family regulator